MGRLAPAIKVCQICADGGWDHERTPRETRLQAINYTDHRGAARVCLVCPICDSADVKIPNQNR